MRRVLAAALAGLILAPAGCGLNVEEPDLFALTRTGPGHALSMVVNSDGAIRCDAGEQKMLSSAQVIQARDLADDLYNDSKRTLTIPRAPGTVYYYRIRMQQGTISFPDLAARRHRELSEATLFAAQAAQRPCGLGG
ncbi:MAG: hypothetical protein JOZ07_06395 [Solirubrobacterales bacterium]|nr:hypothetical protein [Solirubrobacterales bacterium]